MAKAVKISGMKETAPWWLLGLGVLGGGGYLLYKAMKKDETAWPEGDYGPPTGDQTWPPEMGDEGGYGESYIPPTQPPVVTGPPVTDYATPPVTTQVDTAPPISVEQPPKVSVPNKNLGQIVAFKRAMAAFASARPAIKKVFDHVAEMTQWWTTASNKYAAGDPMGGRRARGVADGKLSLAFEAAKSIAIQAEQSAVTLWLRYISASWTAWKYRIDGDNALADKWDAVARSFLAQLNAAIKKAMEALREAQKKARQAKDSQDANGGNGFKVTPGTGTGGRETDLPVLPKGPGVPMLPAGTGMSAKSPMLTAATNRMPPIKQPVAQSSSLPLGAAKSAAPATTTSRPIMTSLERLQAEQAAARQTNSGGALVKDTRAMTATATSTEERKNQVQNGSSMTKRAVATKPTSTAQAPKITSMSNVADQIRAQRNGTVRTTSAPVQSSKSSSVMTLPAKQSMVPATVKSQPVTTTGTMRAQAQPKPGEPRMKAATPQTASRPVQTTPQAPPASASRTVAPVLAPRPAVQRSIAVAPRTTPTNAAKQTAKAARTATLAQQQASAANRSLALLRRA